ncbi:MAG: cobalamin biosynthesis protein [Paracoccaceae bacterium]
MIIAGFGFRKNVQFESLQDVYQTLFKHHKLAVRDICGVATHVDKAQNQALQSLSQHFKLSIIAVSQNEIDLQNTQTHSALSLQHYNTGSLSEAAALAAAGANSYLLGHRMISKDGLATCALAKGDKS